MAELDPELLAGGVVVGAGELRLDRRRALDKLAHFQLEDPHRYVVELLAAAVCAGATEVHIRNDADDFEIEWDGDHPDAPELDTLLDSVFYRGDERRGRMLQHLAQGVLGASGLGPRWVRLHRPGLLLDLTDPGSPQPSPSARSAGTRVEVRERWSFAVVREWASRPFDLPREARLLAEAAAGCPIPVIVNGRPLPRDLPARLQAPTTGQAAPAGRDGAIWLVEAAAGLPEGVQLVRDGVCIDRLPMELGPLRVAGWLRADGLGLNASQSAALQDGRWEALRAEVALTAGAALADRLAVAEELSAGPDAPDGHAELDALRAAGRALLTGPASAAGREPPAALTGLRVWVDLFRRPWSLDALRAAPRALRCDAPELADPSLDLPQLAVDGPERRALERWLSGRLVDGRPELAARAEGRARREALRRDARPWGLDAAWVRPFSFGGADEGGEGLLGLGVEPPGAAAGLELQVDGLPVEALPLDGPRGVRALARAAAFRADARFRAVSPAPLRDAALRAAREALAAALSDPGSAPADPRLRGIWLDALARAAPRRGKDGVVVDDLPAGLRALPLIHRLRGPPVSVEAALTATPAGIPRGEIWFVSERDASDRAVSDSAPPDVLRLDPPALDLLRRLCPARLREVGALLRARADAARRRAAADRRPALPGRLLRSAPVELGDLRGLIGISADQPTRPCAAELLRDGVLLGELPLPIDLPGAVASVEWAGAEPTDDWSGLAQPEAAALALAARLEGPLLDLAAALAPAHARDLGPLPPWLAALARRGPTAGAAAADLPLLRSARGPTSLGALERRSRAGGAAARVRFVAIDAELPPGLPEDLVAVDAERLALLRIWLPKKALAAGDSLLRDVITARQRFYLQEARPLAVDGEAWGRAPIAAPGLRGELAFSATGPDELRLELRDDGRVVSSPRSRLPLSAVAVMEGDAVRAGPRLNELADGVDRDALRAAAVAALPAALEALRRERGDDRGLARVRRRAWAALRALPGLDAAAQARLAEGFAALPVFEVAGRGLVGLAELRAASAQGALAAVRQLSGEVAPPPGRVWVLGDAATMAVLKQDLGREPPSADAEIAALVKGARRRASLPREGLRPPGPLVAWAELPLPGGGRVGIALLSAGPARRDFLTEGRVVLDEPLDCPTPVLVRVDDPGLAPDAAFARLGPPERLAEVRAASASALTAALRGLVAALAAEGSTVELLDHDGALTAALRAWARAPAPLPPGAIVPTSDGRRLNLDQLRALPHPLRLVGPADRGRPVDPARPYLPADPTRAAALGLWGPTVPSVPALAADEAAWARRTGPPAALRPPPGALVEVAPPRPWTGRLFCADDTTDEITLLVDLRALCTREARGVVPLRGWIGGPDLQADPRFERPQPGPGLDALDAALAAAAEGALAELLRLSDPPLAPLIRALLRRFPTRAALAAADGADAALADAPIFRTADGQRRSARQLARGPAAGPRWVLPGVSARSLRADDPLVQADPATRGALQPLLGGRGADAEASAEDAAVARAAAPPKPLALPRARWLAERPFSADGLVGLLGLHPDLHAQGQLHLRDAGRPLEQREAPWRGLVAVLDLPRAQIDPMRGAAELRPPQEAALAEAYAALLADAGPALVDGSHRQIAACEALAACRTGLEREWTAAAARKAPGWARPWAEAPLFAGLAGPTSAAALARAVARGEALLLGADAPELGGVRLHPEEPTPSLLRAAGLPQAAAAAEARARADAAARSAARQREAEAAARQAAAARRLKAVLEALLIDDPGAVAPALRASSAPAAPPSTGSLLADAWRLADAAALSRGGPEASARVCARVADQLRPAPPAQDKG